jgi:hypothetical protein
LLAGILANVLLLLAVGVLYFGFPGTYNQLLHLRFAALPTLPAGGDIVLLQHTVPWGAVSLEAPTAASTSTPQATGTAQATASPQPTNTPQPTGTAQPTNTPQPPNLLQPGGTAGGLAWYRLPRGAHTLVYTAEPFPTVRCRISVPAASGDTCPLLAVPFDATRAMGSPRLMDAQATAEHLPPDQQQALFAAVQSAVSPQPTSMQPFEHYLSSSGQVTLTYQTLQATLVYSVNTDPAHAFPIPTAPPPTGTPTASPSAAPTVTATATAAPSATPSGTPAPPPTCLSLCSAPLPADAPTDAWTQLANLVPSWHYATPSGRVVATSAPAATSGATTMIFVGLKWNGQWQVSAKDADKAALLASTVAASSSGLKLPSGWTIRIYPATNPADGYLVIAGHDNGANQPLAAPTALLLHRFGVLVTANTTARSTFPSLLYGTTQERTLAQQIASQVH